MNDKIQARLLILSLSDIDLHQSAQRNSGEDMYIAAYVLAHLPNCVRRFEHSSITTIARERSFGDVTVNEVQARDWATAVMEDREYSFETDSDHRDSSIPPIPISG